MAYKNISDYGIIGNGYSVALVSNDGSMDWCCLPHFDSPSVFAAILDDAKGGKFHIKPSKRFTTHQAYIKNTNVLQTRFQTTSGEATITDFMPFYRDSRQRSVKFLEIHRMVDCSDGEVSFEALFEPRLDYARGVTSLTSYKHGVLAKGGSQSLSLSSSVSTNFQTFLFDPMRAENPSFFLLSSRLHENNRKIIVSKDNNVFIFRPLNMFFEPSFNKKA